MTQETCILTTKDFTILEVMRDRCLGRDDPLAPLIKRKIDSAVVMFRDDVPDNVATLSSRVSFRIDGRDPDTRVISHDRMRAPVGLFLPITTPRGLALLGLADLLGERLALRLRVLDPGQQLAAAGVEGEQLVDLAGGAAPRQRGLDPLRLGADQLQVEHSGSRSGRGLAGPGRLFGVFARVLGDEPGDRFGLFADDDVLGHDRPREATVLDREERVFIRLGSLIEVRTLRPLAAVAAALGAGGGQGVAARAVAREELGPFVVGVALGDGDALFAEATGGQTEGGG